ncbi:unnamed protein product [Penicillium salamii]|uniref:DUF7136 domain-containing protein n=1 Tax=Penicillium salamii TaxID=1612424 RepID=A0A9W4J2Q4_9EURO|nr:unnamed protein product [Penicillium salamii]CAG8362691.1 unnamed protein product [Penicillium salamii]CAG8366023.1 unnamed protein product [Penicillium salamii]CAG8385961.1 unnamed protein product [Penicillium salamii]
MLNLRAQAIALSLMISLGAADTAGLGLGEIDLIFPRHDTFAPMTITPIVFGIQNPAVIDGLYPTLSYGLWSADTPPNNQTHMTYLAEEHLLNKTGPVSFIIDSIANTLNTENEWRFVWKLRWTNCSMPSNGTTSENGRGLVDTDEFSWRPYDVAHSVLFTTKKGANQLNLTTLNDKCDNTQATAFYTTKTLKAPPSNLWGEKCAVLKSPSPTPAPCKASIAPAAASSISSSLTARYCMDPTPVISCPAKKGGASINTVGSDFSWCLMGALLVGKLFI